VTTSGLVTTLTGGSSTSGHADGVGSAATFNMPYAVAVDGDSILYVSDYANCMIRKIVRSKICLHGCVGKHFILCALLFRCQFHCDDNLCWKLVDLWAC
jgi:hypothetical protein